MPFELHNPNKRAVTCSFHQPVGTIMIPGGTFVPTPEQEENGLQAEDFKDFVPSFLKPTPPVVRRRLLEGSQLDVPEDLIAATSHLAEFGGVVEHREASHLEVLVPPRPHREKEEGTSGHRLEEGGGEQDVEKTPNPDGEPEDTVEDPVESDDTSPSVPPPLPDDPEVVMSSKRSYIHTDKGVSPSIGRRTSRKSR